MCACGRDDVSHVNHSLMRTHTADIISTQSNYDSPPVDESCTNQYNTQQREKLSPHTSNEEEQLWQGPWIEDEVC